MNLFISEAFFTGLKESLKILSIYLVFSGLAGARGRADLKRYFYAGLGISGVFLGAGFFIPFDSSMTPALKYFVAHLAGYTFFVFFALSVISLYQSSGTELFWGFRPHIPLAGVVTGLTVFYFFPDIVGSSFYLRELALMKMTAIGVYGFTIAGFILPLAVFFGLKLGRLSGQVARYFDLPQFLLFVSIVKLLGGGLKGYSEFSLIPMIQNGLMKFIHDVVHQTFVFLMVPDHPMLKITTWNFIGILFGSNIAMAGALLLLLMPAALFLFRSLFSPLITGEEEGLKGAERRALRAAIRAERRKKALPVVFFVLFIFSLWYASAGERAITLYNPSARPLVSDKGQVIIPLTDPTMDLFDGKIHKFSLTEDGVSMRLLVMKKPDGRLAVCLDACEICPPEGYGQTEGHVVCIYCRTPIPVGTLGQSGGCNPIPLGATVSESEIRITVDEILKKWKEVGKIGGNA